MGVTADGIEAAAVRLRQAATLRRQCRPLADLLDGATEADAYAVQALVLELQQISGAAVCGRKLLRPASPDTAEPVHGVLVDTMLVGSGRAVALRHLLAPVVEVKLALRFDADLTTYADPRALRRGLVSVSPAIEISDRRAGGGELSRIELIADNALAGLVAIGEPAMLVPDEPEDAFAARVEDVLGDIHRLGVAESQRGRPVRAGEIVLTPTSGGGVPARAGRTYRSEGPGGSVASLAIVEAPDDESDRPDHEENLP
jgi:2-keto-4-pentenoate hydratase